MIRMYDWKIICIVIISFGWLSVATIIDPQQQSTFVKLEYHSKTFVRGGSSSSSSTNDHEEDDYKTIGIIDTSLDSINDHFHVNIPSNTTTTTTTTPHQPQFLSIPSSSSIQSIRVPSTTTTTTPLDPTVLHTMGALCDIILCFIPNNDDDDKRIQELLKQIQMGIERKNKNNHHPVVKTQIILFVNQQSKQVELQDLSASQSNDDENPNYQLSIHPLSTNYTQDFWKQIVAFSSSSSLKSTMTKDVPLSLFPTLVHQVLNSQLFPNQQQQQQRKYHCQVETIHLPTHFSSFEEEDREEEDREEKGDNDKSKEEMISQVVSTIERKEENTMQEKTNKKLSVNHNMNDDASHNASKNKNKKMNKKKIEKLVWGQVRSIFDRLQDKVEQYAFDYSSTNGKSMPILEFRSDAEKIIKTALQRAENETDSILIQQTIAGSNNNESVDTPNIYTLFQQHIQNLREYYGCGYESILDDYLEKEIDSDNEEDVDPKKRDAIWTAAASRATEGFRTAANHAIPNVIRSKLQSKYQSYVTSEMEGLIRDLIQATQMREPLTVQEEDDDGDDLEEETYTRNRPTWYKKLFARVLALGVNYLQGWLAYQGLKKAANERDELIPKFPAF